RYRGLSLCLTQKCLIFKCFAVLPLQIFSCKDGLKPQEYCRISRLKTFLPGKRPRQNRVSHCGAPPNGRCFFLVISFVGSKPLKSGEILFNLSDGVCRYAERKLGGRLPLFLRIKNAQKW
ncbi:MAG: hypothetical protein IJC46_04795, partial [Clostridia bacterium]|nr:hypothetical protein [Clostridia bacterium]